LKGGGGERWGVAQWVYAQYSELGKFVIAKVEVENKLRGWLEFRWLKRVSERVSPKARVLPRRSRVIYGTSSLIFLPLLFKDGLKSFLV
jgi:hypothetical protein